MRFPSLIEIAGISYTGCRAKLLNGEEFADSFRGSVNNGIDSTPHIHGVETLYRGLPFGVIVAPDDDSGVEISKVNQTLNAIKTNRATVGFFVFRLDDAQYSISVKAIPDYNQVWYSTGDKYSGEYVSQVTFRFIVREAIAVSLSA